MDQSSFEAMFVGIFVLIFVAAVSTTIFLFNEIIEYSENLFDASNKFIGESVLVLDNVKSTNENNIIRGVDALAYVTNFGCYDTNGSTYIYSRKYTENVDLKVKIRLRNLSGAYTRDVDIAGYYKLNIIRTYLDSSIIVELVQYTEAAAGV